MNGLPHLSSKAQALWYASSEFRWKNPSTALRISCQITFQIKHFLTYWERLLVNQDLYRSYIILIFINFTQLSEVQQHCILYTVQFLYALSQTHGPKFQLSKSHSSELYWQQAVSVPAPLNANELHLSTPTCLLQAPLWESMALMLAVACANIMADAYICIAMAHWDAFVQPYQFGPESDPEREASEEVQTLWLRQDVSELLVCLNTVCLLVC